MKDNLIFIGSTRYQAGLEFSLIANKINMGTALHKERIPVSEGITTCKEGYCVCQCNHQ